MQAVPYVDLATQHRLEREALMGLVSEVMAKGQWVGGEQVQELEQRLAAVTGARRAVTVGSGTDALVLSLRALDIGPGHEVITPPNSFVSSTAAIVQVGATPVFADVLDDQNLDPDKLEAAITERTRAVMPVHLTGRMARMQPICEVAATHGLAVVEDAAQAFGSTLDGRAAGTWGRVGCFSAHPLKNLNAMGDAGFVLTDDEALADRLGQLRNNGLVDRNTVAEWGTVSRLDTLQAAVLLYRLGQLDDVITRRRRNADRYRKQLQGLPVFHPADEPGQFNTFHTFVVQVERRDELKSALAEQGIGTSIHYPVPIHLQPAARELGYATGDFPVAERQAGRILSLPIHQFLSDESVDAVAAAIGRFYG